MVLPLAATGAAMLTDPMGKHGASATDLDTLLLLIAFRRQPREANADAGHVRIEAIVGRPVGATDFAAAIRRLLDDRLIHDPVFLAAGALQCHWRLEPTPEGFAVVQALMQKSRKSVDELIAELSNP
jgi:hypothetical protein